MISLKFEKIDHTVADFDRILYRIHNPEKDKSKLLVSLLVNFFDELKEYDVEGVSGFFPHDIFIPQLKM